ncbi:PAS domain S-box-containing protein [Nocardioides exalbidus]|uniref:histidine kinase n=1 Tax=Nocardioides exalbidus TaxID=402596 RepID=A0A1H4LHG7_9ACTN|nr:PAS domain-containing sensor histidine kinase [Nocardioides exalbidus]SEB70160.1 PAS domain S-box-containing protein [Nocardioides exalbidus]
MSVTTRALPTDDLWRLTVEHSPVGMAIVSPDGHFQFANVALCDMLGYDPDVMATLSFHDITHSDDLASDLRLVDQCLSGEIGSYRITKRYVCADGTTLIGDLSVALLRDPDGTPIHFISQIADLTERHAFVERLDAAEEAIESERRKAEAVFDSVAVGLLLLDADGAYQGYNHRHSEFMALAFPDGHLGRVGQLGFLYDEEQARLLTSEEMPTVRAVAGEEFDDLLLWVGEDPQTRRAVSVSARSVRDRFGAHAGAALAYQDVTDKIRAEKVKDDFVSTVSHELRTPLTSALAYLELLEESDDVSEDGRQQVVAVRRNVLRLSHLVADLLLATRATAGSTLVDFYRLDLATTITEAVESAAPDAERAGVRLTLVQPESVPVVADGMRMRHVVDNLLANAVLYTPRDGEVTVSVAAEADKVVVSVADTGDGIAPDDLPHVFDRFFRGANALRDQAPGAGLGLAIVRTIVEAHGGAVNLESAPAAGTTVSVVLPR